HQNLSRSLRQRRDSRNPFQVYARHWSLRRCHCHTPGCQSLRFDLRGSRTESIPADSSRSLQRRTRAWKFYSEFAAVPLAGIKYKLFLDNQIDIIETSAGVIPLILATCPSELGRVLANFCLVSERRPGMSA